MNALNEAMWEQPNFWKEGTFQAYKHYMDSAFRTYTGVGNDAQIKTNADQKRQLPNWKPEWEKRLTGSYRSRPEGRIQKSSRAHLARPVQ